MSETTAMMVSELRRNPQLSYKNDIIFISGLDEGDKKVLQNHYKSNDPPCQVDPDDGRFVMKGPCFNPSVIVNLLAKERGYKIAFNPQQRSIPLKPGSVDDKFALIYFLSKPIASCQSTATGTASTTATSSSVEPAPPPRVDSLPSSKPDIVSSEQ